MSKIYPTTLFASKIEATLVVKLQMMVTFLWWMKASFPSCSKIPLDEVSAPSVLLLLYPRPPKKRYTSSARIFFWKGTNYPFNHAHSEKEEEKAVEIFTWVCGELESKSRSGLTVFVEDILRGTPLAARAWKWYRLECYIEYASRKITSIVNSR